MLPGVARIGVRQQTLDFSRWRVHEKCRSCCRIFRRAVAIGLQAHLIRTRPAGCHASASSSAAPAVAAAFSFVVPLQWSLEKPYVSPVNGSKVEYSKDDE